MNEEGKKVSNMKERVPLIPKESLQGTTEIIRDRLTKTGKEIQTLVNNTVEPVKDILPESIKIAEWNPDPGGYRAGGFIAVEYLPGEGRLIMVSRQYAEELETYEGDSMGVVMLPEPIEKWRHELHVVSWIKYGVRVIEKIGEVLEVVEKGEEWIEEPPLRFSGYQPARPLIPGF